MAARAPETWERIRARVERQLSVVELHAHRLLETGQTTDTTSGSRKAARTLAQWFGPLEMPAPAALARQMVQLIEQDGAQTTTAVQLAALADDIRLLVASAVAEHDALTSHDSSVALIGPPNAYFDAVAWILARRGHEIVDGEFAVPSHVLLNAIVIHLSEHGAARNALRSVRASHPLVPIVGLIEPDDLPGLADLAGTCDVFVTPNDPPATIALEVGRAIEVRNRELRLVVVGPVDIDTLPDWSSMAIDKVEPDDPAELLEALAEPSSALVLGPDLADETALTLARLVSARAGGVNTPVVSLGTYGDLTRARLASTGVLLAHENPDWPSVLAHSLRRDVGAAFTGNGRVEHSLLPWPAAQLLIDRALVAAHRSVTPVSLATIRLDDATPQEVVRSIRETLRVEFRRHDIVGIRGDREFVVSLQGAPRHVATQRLDELAHRLSFEDHKVRVGIAQFPLDGTSTIELVTAGDAAIGRAIGRAGPTVAPTDWRPEYSDAMDVLIVDPDAILSSVLTSALSSRGVVAKSVQNGHDALDILTSQNGPPLPQLVVLELDTPGIDGLQLLEHLRSSAILGRLRVLLLTARSRDADIQHALALGAEDVVRKPFSTTLFLHRAQRLLSLS